jgi:mannose/fructose/N-acetylgalactosamine-specific phosphotransferase system component IIB
VSVGVFGVDEAIQMWNGQDVAGLAAANQSRWTEGGEPVLVLVRDPVVALSLVEGGVPLRRVNVGNLAPQARSVRVFRNISLSPPHIAALDALEEQGIEVFLQLTPDDARLSWEAVRKRALG